MRTTGLIVLLGVLATTAGCELFSGAKKEFTTRVATPTAKVRAVKVLEQTDQGARVLVTVQLDNPNAVPLPLVRADYRVSVDGVAARLSDKPNRTLPSRDRVTGAPGRQVLELPAVLVTNQPVAGAAYDVMGSVTYETPGEIRRIMTESKVPLPSAAFEGSGQVEP